MTEKEIQARKEQEEKEREVKKLIILYGLLHKAIELEIIELYKKSGKWDWVSINKYGRFQKTYKQISAKINQFRKDEVKLIKKALKTRYNATYVDTIITLNRLGFKNLTFAKISENELKAILDVEWSGVKWSERIWKNQEALKLKLKDLITRSAITEDNLHEISKKLAIELKTSVSNAERLLRTEYNRVQYLADMKAYEEAGITKVQYNSVLDLNTCDNCSSLHNKIYTIGKEPSLPRHPNCQCFYEPVQPKSKIL